MGQTGMDPVAMQMNIRNNTMEMQDCIKDLYKWEADMHKKEEQLKKSRTSRGSAEKAPIRGNAPAVRKTTDPELSKPADALAYGSSTSQKQAKTDSPGVHKTAASHTYDYFKDRWDKFDVDAALAAVDQPAQSKKEPLSEVVDAGNGSVQEESPVKAQRSPEDQRDMWKSKGNEFFKIGDLHKAKECYSASLAAKESNAAYTNRALACIKLKEWQQAEDDCTKVITSDPSNLKAWQRRAEARKGKGNAEGHLKDLDAALRLVPESSAISQQLRQALPKHLRGIGLSMPSLRAAINIEAADVCNIEPQQAPQQLERPHSCSQESRPELSAASGVHESGAPVAAGSLQSPAGTNVSDTAENHRSSAEEASRVEISSEQAGGSPASPAAEPIVSVDCESKNSDGHEARCGESSTATNSVTKEQVLLPSVELHVPSVAPTTSADFEVHWRGTKGNQAARAAYLGLINPASVVTLFGSTLTPDVLEGIVRSVLLTVQSDGSVQKASRWVQLLREMTRVQRFSMNLMLVSKGAKQGLTSLWEQCINGSGQESIQAELSELKKLYKL